MDDLKIVEGIRSFNRYYTNLLGLLDNKILDLPYSLSEARIIFELYDHEKCTLKDLNGMLGMDYGYLSRIIKKFVECGLCTKTPDENDKRVNYIALTEKGNDLYMSLSKRSNEQIRSLIGHLSQEESLDLWGHMESIIKMIEDNSEPVIHIRHEIKPGDIGYLIKMHGEHYYETCGYDHTFEGYVCHTFEEFLENYSPEKDRMWLAESGGRIVGSIAIVSRSESRGQLRWFLIDPKYRGMGLGKNLLETALEYSKVFGFESIFLETTQDQEKAVGMYKAKGFKKIRETPVELWGGKIVEETYELILKL